jgi:competence ComEA-like helix-hairpin-helix protein
MGIYDRDYMRNRGGGEVGSWLSRLGRTDWHRKLLLASTAIAVLSAAVWLVRDFKQLMPNSTPAKGSLIVNINSGTADELETVPGIGPTLAQSIMADREYSSVNDLERVSGIGPNNLEGMRPFLTVDGPTRPRL